MAGRKTKYTRKIAEQLPSMFENGESVVEVCVNLGIVKDTFYRWCKEHKEFEKAYKQGLEISEAWWQKLGRAGALGTQKINAATWIFNMKNRFKWSDRTQVESDNAITISPVSFVDDIHDE
nr:MAG TPA: Terminase small subunit [Caudoviricetes sp.]